METRYEASMVLSGVGDALGYNNGVWEFCQDGELIHKQLENIGGLEKLDVKNMGVSDDTVLHLAVAEALIASKTEEDVYNKMMNTFLKAMEDMVGRAPGNNTLYSCDLLKKTQKPEVPFSETAGSCGAAMRSMCIGLRYPRPEEIDKLVAVSVESGRMTHHHPTGYLGAMASALFTSYAIQGKPVKQWGRDLLAVIPTALQYIEQSGRYLQKNKLAWPYFEEKWTQYLTERGIIDGDSDPVFPENYGVKERDELYRKYSYGGWGGASGHDAPMIAYDALLGAGKSWKELCHRGMFHYGDSDSTAVIAGACFGAMYGYDGVPTCNYQDLEYKTRLVDAGKGLFLLSQLKGQIKGNPVQEKPYIHN